MSCFNLLFGLCPCLSYNMATCFVPICLTIFSQCPSPPCITPWCTIHCEKTCIVLRKGMYCAAKGHLLQRDTPPFAAQKVAFRKTVGFSPHGYASPISLAFSMSKAMRGSRSLGTRSSSTASFSVFFSSPTSLEGFRWNSCIISVPSMQGWSSRL